MASYEIEHNVPPPKKPTTTSSTSPGSSSSTTTTRPRPNLSTFYTSLEHVDTSSVSNANALPASGDVAASYRLLGQSMQALMADNPNEALLIRLLESISANIDAPPARPKGLPDEFVEGLERVAKKGLKREDECAICGGCFLEDEYPLVVRLPCDDKHIFDLDCIQPWFKLNSTCPLDRKDLAVNKQIPQPVKGEEKEEYDDMYG